MMRENPTLIRFTTRAVLAAVLCNATVMAEVSAQPPAASSMQQPLPPPLPLPDQAQPSNEQVDPPSRVGRVADVSGAVSFHSQGDTQWTPARVNYPVSAGDTYWTEPSAGATLDVGTTRIVMAGKTEFGIASLDTNGMQAVAAQGETYLHLRDLAAGEEWSVQTPRGLVHLNSAGRYNIVVGSTEQPTLVTVVDGSADIEGPGVALHLESQETARIEGTDDFQGAVETAAHDRFLAAQLDAERPVIESRQIPPQVVDMPGGEALINQGDWARTPEYGAVWYPPVAAGWVPYRDGHWAYVAPWGWTWIDDAPWGFAPSHYGRWIELEGRWAWTPGARPVVGPPVYAPALVTFLAIGAGVGAAVAAGHVGWVPLGPREPFRPWYHASGSYLRSVNNGPVTNVTNNVTISSFANRSGATSVPAEAMIASRPLRALARPLGEQEVATARPLAGVLPLRPTWATAGITPAAARQFNVPQTSLPIAPGPALHAPTLPSSASGLARPRFDPQDGPRPALPMSRPTVTGPQPVGGNPVERGQPARQEPPHMTGPVRPQPPVTGQFEPGLVRQPQAPGQSTAPARTQPSVPVHSPRSERSAGTEPHQEAPPRRATEAVPAAPMPHIERPTPPAAAARPEPPRVSPPATMPQREQQHSEPAAVPPRAPSAPNQNAGRSPPPEREKRPN